MDLKVETQIKIAGLIIVLIWLINPEITMWMGEKKKKKKKTAMFPGAGSVNDLIIFLIQDLLQLKVHLTLIKFTNLQRSLQILQFLHPLFCPNAAFFSASLSYEWTLHHIIERQMVNGVCWNKGWVLLGLYLLLIPIRLICVNTCCIFINTPPSLKCITRHTIVQCALFLIVLFFFSLFFFSASTTNYFQYQ